MRPETERARLFRHSRKALRFGEPVPVCLGCGCASVEVLTGVSFRLLPGWLARRIIEGHHPAGRAVDLEWEVTLCRNCHALASDRQYDLPAIVRRPLTERERHAAELSAVDDWLGIVGLPVDHHARARVRAAAEFLLDKEGRRPS